MLRKEEVEILMISADFIWLEEIREGLEEEGFVKTNLCVDAEIAIKALEHYEPNVVIVDQMIRHKDGLSIVEYIREKGMESNIILVIHYTSELMNWKVETLNVEYVLLKPTSQEIVVTRVKDIIWSNLSNKSQEWEKNRENEVGELCNAYEEEDEDPLMIIDQAGLENNIGRILMGFGIMVHLKGYQYLKTAITMTIINQHITNSITKELYPQLAYRYNTTASRVERDMRHAIEKAWDNTPVAYKKAYFGVQYLNETRGKKPTNALFINTIAEKVKHNLKGQIALMGI